MSYMYAEPRDFGLETIGEIEWGDGGYSFDLTVVWKRLSDGFFVYGEDSGCSCPAPFEDQGVEDLTVLPKRNGLNVFKAHCEKRIAELSSWNEHMSERLNGEMVVLLERMHGAGAR